ncbi:hypothetical protein [Nitratifractor sp.]
MLIFGHPWVEGPRFVKIFTVEEIDGSKAREILLLEPLNVSIDLVRHCRRNGLAFALTISTLKEALLANALGAAYVLCQHEIGIEIQKVAEEYLFDTKVLVLVEEEREIETMARFGIDGVVFPRAIVQL